MVVLYHISPTVGLDGGVDELVDLNPPPTIFPPTFKLPPIPTPPATVNAPVTVLVLEVTLVIVNISGEVTCVCVTVVY